MVAKVKKVEKTNNKNLAIIVLLIIAGVVILGYISDNTGFVSKEGKTEIMVSGVNPNDQEVSSDDLEINAGEGIYITIEPGIKGYDGNTLDIYQRGNFGKKIGLTEVKVQYCGSKCTEKRVLKYTTSSNWGGTYYASVKDSGTGKVEETSFEVVPKEPR